MSYLQAENLKHKRTFTKKLIFLAPFVTLLINGLAPLWFQINSYNWWYVLLYPGFLTLICALVEQRDNGKLKYRTVFSLPVSLTKIWKAKIGIAGIYSCAGNLIFIILNLFCGFAILSVYGVPMTIGVLRAAAGTFTIVCASLWEIPFCLWLSKKFGIFAAAFLNAGIGSVLGILAATSSLWILCPYSWVPRLMVSVLHILPSGEIAGDESMMLPSWLIVLTILLSLSLFAVLTVCTAKWFAKKEAK